MTDAVCVQDIPTVCGTRSGPAYPVPLHLRPAKHRRCGAAVLFSRIAGVFPGDADLIPIEVAVNALIAGEG